MIPRGKGDFKLHIEKEGYQPVDILLTQSLYGWLWGNILFGGLIGLAVDFITGDAYDLEPELISANLQGVSQLLPPKGGSLEFGCKPTKVSSSILKSPSGGSIPCSSMYFIMTSSVTLPELAAK